MLAVRPVEKDLEEEKRPKSATTWTHAQADSTQEEQDLWSTKGACVRNIMIDGFVQEVGLWGGPNEEMVLPERYLPMMVLEAPGPSHLGVDTMRRLTEAFWNPEREKYLKEVSRNCKICQEHNLYTGINPEPGKYPHVQQPGEEIVMDFTDMGVRGKRYLYRKRGCCQSTH